MRVTAMMKLLHTEQILPNQHFENWKEIIWKELFPKKHLHVKPPSLVDNCAAAN